MLNARFLEVLGICYGYYKKVCYVESLRGLLDASRDITNFLWGTVCTKKS